jgi:hypothetical protein
MYILQYRHNNAERNYDIKRTNGSSINAAQFKQLQVTVSNENLIQEEN